MIPSKEDKKTVAEILETRMNKTPSELIQERCNEYYNEAVDDCIEVVIKFQKSQPMEAGIQSPLRGRSANSIMQNILWQLLKLKKPIQ